MSTTVHRHRHRAAPLRSGTAVVVAGLLAACGPGGEQQQTPADESTGAAATTFPLTIDNCGQQLILDAQPQSVLSIGMSAVALLDAAGASDLITARAGEFGAELPAGLTDPPQDADVIDPADPSTETIVGADPDVVVGYGLFGSSDDDLAALGIPSITIDGECSHDAAVTEPTDFDALFADVERLAEVFGTEQVAAERIAEMRSELEVLEAGGRDAADQPQSAAAVYYFSDSGTLSAYGGQGIADDVMSRAGLQNSYHQERSVYVEINVETLLDADPDVLVLAYGLYGETFQQARERLLAEPGAQDLSAVQQDRVVGVPATDLAPDPGALRGLRTLLAETGQDAG